MHAPLPAAVLRKLACDDECSRGCVCCGTPTPTQSMCACWPHRTVLPEISAQTFLKSYGRDEFANYHRDILKAIETWRQLGVWRVPSTGGWRAAKIGPRSRFPRASQSSPIASSKLINY